MNSYENDLNFYQAPNLLWNYIKDECPQSELIEIKKLLGDSLVEHTLELYSELLSLLEIWNISRNDKPLQACRLPEPPSVKEILLCEIKYFIESIRKKATNFGKNYEDYINSNSSTIQYAIKSASSSGISSRCSSRLSTTPLSTFRDRTSTDSSLSAEILNLEGVENTLENFRGILEEEVERLSEDIQYIRESLEITLEPEPSFNDLKQECENLSKIDKQLDEIFLSDKKELKPDSVSLNSKLKQDTSQPLNPILRKTQLTSPTVLESLKITSKITDNQPPLKSFKNEIVALRPNSELGIVKTKSTLESSSKSQNDKQLSNFGGDNKYHNKILLIDREHNPNNNNTKQHKRDLLANGNKKCNANQKPISQKSKCSSPPFTTSHITIQIKKSAIPIQSISNEISYEANDIVPKSTSAQRFRNMVKECRTIE